MSTDPPKPPERPAAPPPALRPTRDRPEYHVPEGWEGKGPLPQESAHIRRSVWWLPVIAIGFLVGLWTVIYLGSRGEGPPAGPRDLTAQFLMLRQAFQGPGVTPFEGTRREITVALRGHVGPHAAVPDLSAVGLEPLGARALNTGDGMGMIRYADTTGGPDVLAVLAPPGHIGVPEGTPARDLPGGTVYLQEAGPAHVLYAETYGLEWALISDRDADALAAVGAALLAAAPRRP
jgi:hypothetical protein